ncbi:MAG TPA: four helix bundle protein [Gemmatimonadaceae bacterium]|nr:four helix bundle protein [Gemmatimonadaceae bacterium]
MTYGEWEGELPDTIRLDPIWRTKAYRLALFLTELARLDGSRIQQRAELQAVLPQLYLSLGSIGANIAEGYSRMTGRDRARFFEYALGSAREARHWYFAVRGAISAAELHDRLQLLDETIRLLVAMVTRQRSARPVRGPEASRP